MTHRALLDIDVSVGYAALASGFCVSQVDIHGGVCVAHLLPSGPRQYNPADFHDHANHDGQPRRELQWAHFE